MECEASFRFYAELNDFPGADQRGRDLAHPFDGRPSVKDAIAAQGVPHPGVELIVANGHSVGFDYLLRCGVRIAVYPVFESYDVAPERQAVALLAGCAAPASTADARTQKR